jgi:putative SOS response-associated peptidase YedK
MCGRFAFYSPQEAITRLFGVSDPPPVEPRFNIAPTQLIAVVRAGETARSLSMLYWGLVPHWARDRAIGARMINARSETLREKPSFRTAYRRRRCLVLANGYYEWQRLGSVRQPWYIGLGTGEPFAMAGLWEHWQNPVDQTVLESCTIITTAPAASIAHIHNRMPVIVPADAYEPWLDPANERVADLDTLLVACDPAALRAWPVSREVNNARNQGASLIEPWTSAAEH